MPDISGGDSNVGAGMIQELPWHLGILRARAMARKASLGQHLHYSVLGLWPNRGHRGSDGSNSVTQ